MRHSSRCSCPWCGGMLSLSWKPLAPPWPQVTRAAGLGLLGHPGPCWSATPMENCAGRGWLHRAACAGSNGMKPGKTAQPACRSATHWHHHCCSPTPLPLTSTRFVPRSSSAHRAATPAAPPASRVLGENCKQAEGNQVSHALCTVWWGGWQAGSTTAGNATGSCCPGLTLSSGIAQQSVRQTPGCGHMRCVQEQWTPPAICPDLVLDEGGQRKCVRPRHVVLAAQWYRGKRRAELFRR